MKEHKIARFSIGQRVVHRLFDYRGVIFNVDAEFSGDEEWYQQVAKSRPPKEAPWYHVLPDGAEHTTYVAERNLIGDNSLDDIDHPLIDTFFDEVTEDGYVSYEKLN